MFVAQGLDRGDRPGVSSRSEFHIFDRNPDPALDELTELAAMLSASDYAYIGWMDFSRIWFKSTYGFQGIEQPRYLRLPVDAGEGRTVTDPGGCG